MLKLLGQWLVLAVIQMDLEQEHRKLREKQRSRLEGVRNGRQKTG
jgi:hypothetical protein